MSCPPVSLRATRGNFFTFSILFNFLSVKVLFITPIELLRLSERTTNALVRNGVESVELLSVYSDDELLSLRGLGPVGISEIHQSRKLLTK